MNIRNLFALHMHVGLPHGERVDICLRVEVGETVVHEAVRGLVGPDGVDDIEERRLWPEPPVVDRNLRRGLLRPLWKPPGFELCDAPGAESEHGEGDDYVLGKKSLLCENGLFFEMPDKAMACLGGDQVS